MPPVIMEMNIDEMDTVSLSVNNKAQSDLYNYVNNKIVPEFEKITTVTDVSISGGQKEYIQVQLIPEKLEQYHLNLLLWLLPSAAQTLPIRPVTPIVEARSFRQCRNPV